MDPPPADAGAGGISARRRADVTLRLSDGQVVRER
jgi:hypothetical protein